MFYLEKSPLLMGILVWEDILSATKLHVRSEVITAVAIKYVVFWDIKHSSYLTGDTLLLHCKSQAVNTM
jgi:hypothetical protein